MFKACWPPIGRRNIAEKARTAVFYSISNCQQGLAGISFGNFLIKQVVEELRRELPRLDQFVTLVARSRLHEMAFGRDDAPIAKIDPASAGSSRERRLDRFGPERRGFCAACWSPWPRIISSRPKRPKGDPSIRWRGFTSAMAHGWSVSTGRATDPPRACVNSATIMVNYLYDLDEIEANHEAFVNNGEIVAAPAVRKLLRGETRSLFPSRRARTIRNEFEPGLSRVRRSND